MIKRSDECFACSSRKCCFHIYTDEGDFDEVACGIHTRALEVHADAVLGDRVRMHVASATNLKRQSNKANAPDDVGRSAGWCGDVNGVGCDPDVLY